MDVEGLTRAWLDAYNAKNLDRLAALLADDFRWSDPDIDSEMDRETFLDTCHRIAEQIPDRIDLHEMVLLNHYAVALSAEWRGTPIGDSTAPRGPVDVVGTELRSGESMIVEVSDGRIGFIRVYR